MVKFGELYAEPVRNGLTRPTRVRGAGYRMVNMGELFAFDRINGQQMELVPLNERELRVATLNEGDLLFARSSLKMEGTGKCSIVAGVPETTTFESHLIRARLNTEIADPRFYFYYFQSRHGRTTVLSIAKQVGAAGLAGSQLATLSIPFPSLSTQSAAADILWQYDDLIDNNNRRIKLLEDAARLLYEEWFVRLRFPGHEHTPVNDGVPEGWEPLTFGDLCDAIREPVLPESVVPDTPYFGLEHLPRRSVTLGSFGRADEVSSTKHRFLEGDILFGKIRPYFHKVGIAFVDGIVSSDAIVIRSRDDSLRTLVLMTASSDPFVAVTSKTMREGSKMPRADWSQMQAYSTPLPPTRLLVSFDSAIRPILAKLRNLSLASKQARIARDLLLPRLMSGEVAV